MRFKMQTDIGFRWLNCGARLYRRNPWLLTGMGATLAILLGLVALVPFVGILLIGLLAPALAASTYLVLDRMAKEKKPVAPHARADMLKRAPLELFRVFRDEDRLITMTLACLYCAAVVLLVQVTVWFIAGRALMKPIGALTLTELVSVAVAAAVAASCYLLLATSLIYALPLAFLQDEPPGTAVARSFGTGLRYPIALLTTLLPILLPIALYAIAGIYSVWLGYLIAALAVSVVLPWMGSALYCSYRTVFAPPNSPVPAMRSSSSQRA